MTTATIVILMCSGLVAGFLSSLLGIGGGVIAVPILVLVLGLSTKIAVGTSLLVIAPTALLGVLLHLRHGNVNLSYAVIFMSLSFVGAYLGVKASHVLPDEILRKIFAVVFMIIAVKMFLGR